MGRPPALALLLVALSLSLPARADAPADAAVAALQGDSSLKVRTQAAIVLGQRADPSVIPALREAVAKDRAAAVRIAAVGALAKLNARAARSTLVAARDTDEDAAVRQAAARAVEALGPVALSIEPATGTASARGVTADALARHLRDRGVEIGANGEVRLKPAVDVGVSEQGGKTVVAVRLSLVAVDLDGRMEMVESTAKASVAGALAKSKLAGVVSKAVDAAARGLCEDLAGRLGWR
jgi:hypothetical protein